MTHTYVYRLRLSNQEDRIEKFFGVRLFSLFKNRQGKARHGSSVRTRSMTIPRNIPPYPLQRPNTRKISKRRSQGLLDEYYWRNLNILAGHWFLFLEKGKMKNILTKNVLVSKNFLMAAFSLGRKHG